MENKIIIRNIIEWLNEIVIDKPVFDPSDYDKMAEAFIKTSPQFEARFNNVVLADVSNSTFNYEDMKEQTNGKVAIRKSCPNQQCFCTGACQEIIGWRDKLPNEH